MKVAAARIPQPNSHRQAVGIDVQLAKLSRKSAVAGAIRYSLDLSPTLTRYCEDGWVEIDNNAAERAAAIYTLIGSAKLNGVDPAAYLRFVLERIADHPIKRIADLLPWNVHPIRNRHSEIDNWQCMAGLCYHPSNPCSYKAT